MIGVDLNGMEGKGMEWKGREGKGREGKNRIHACSAGQGWAEAISSFSDLFA
ncbi:MAG: hypothetical protein QXI39_00145 [Candidatus Bathyarchaeia archaeon]